MVDNKVNNLVKEWNAFMPIMTKAMERVNEWIDEVQSIKTKMSELKTEIESLQKQPNTTNNYYYNNTPISNPPTFVPNNPINPYSPWCKTNTTAGNKTNE